MKIFENMKIWGEMGTHGIFGRFLFKIMIPSYKRLRKFPLLRVLVLP